jgi:hypothetical protein
MTQAQLAAVVGTSTARICRVERGRASRLSIAAVHRHGAAVGLKPWVRLYPAVSRPLDSAQLALLNEVRRRSARSWNIRLEVPMPLSGDLRAVDALFSMAGCTCAVEAVTRLADVQAQVRAARAKQRDIGAGRLILVVAANGTNRRVVREAGPILRESFPLSTKAVMAALGRGIDPGADGIALVDVPPTPLTKLPSRASNRELRLSG